MEQGKAEILKILESATDNEYYYNCKKRKGFFDNNFNKRLQNHIKSPKTIIKPITRIHGKLQLRQIKTH